MSELPSNSLSRRKALGLLGAFGAVGLVGCGGGGGGELSNTSSSSSGGSSSSSSSSSGGTTTACLLTPALTEGPYFVDEKLNRSDIRGGQTGMPLALTVNVYNANSSSCAPLSGVQIDIWHTNASGLYSDINVSGNAGQQGQTYLRGYQVSNASGNAVFSTLWPGWYSGRAVHIHVKARIYDASNNVTKEFNTQIFFNDTTTDSVFTTAPYNARGARNVRNSNDGIYNGAGSSRESLVLVPTGSNASGYAGTFSVGLSV